MIAEKIMEEVANQFGLKNASIEPLGDGIIHFTYKAAANGNAIVMQQINTKVFTKPEVLIDNYLLVYQFLQQTGSIHIPEPVETEKGEWLVKDPAGNCWRATEFIGNAYSPDSVKDAGAAYITAACFGRFSRSLQGLNVSELDVVIV